jgi:hypothetical protein
LRKQNIGQLIQEATLISSNIISAAAREGIVQSVQLPPAEPIEVPAEDEPEKAEDRKSK